MGFGGGIWHAGHAWGYQYGGPTSTPNPIPSLIRAGESIPTPYREGRREDGMGRGRGRRGRRTVDPPTPMGQKGVRWCGGGAGVSTVSRPVGIVVGRTRGAFPPRITCSPKPRTGGPRPLDWATWNGGGRKGGRGRQGRGKSKRRRGAGVVTGAVVVATIVVVAFVVAVDKGGEGAANNLGDRGRSYGGPQREGRVIVQGG